MKNIRLSIVVIFLSFLLLISFVNCASLRNAQQVAVGGGNDEQKVPQSTIFTLYDNGSSNGGIDITLSRDDFPKTTEEIDDNGNKHIIKSSEKFAINMSKHIKVSKYKAIEPVIATKAFREDGELITNFNQLLPIIIDNNNEEETQTKRRIYLVADGLEFVWPFIELGHQQVVSTNVISPILDDKTPIIIESISEIPRVFRIFNMFKDDEAQFLIDNALNLTGRFALKRSTVGNSKDVSADGVDGAHEDSGRTSDNAWDSDTKVAKDMISRSFNITRMVEDAGKIDGLQIVRYQNGQGYNTHPDYFTKTDDNDYDFYPYSGGSNRFATVFMYLNNVEEGGFTAFPRAPSILPPDEQVDPPDHALNFFKPGTWQHRVTQQCYSKLAVPPKLGTAALFYSITPDGQIEPNSHHAACPVTTGIKWGANIWLWNKQRYGEIKTGEPRSLNVVNTLSEDVYLTWEGKDNGIIGPGDHIHIGTFQFHRFKAHIGSRSNKAFTEFTVQNDPDKQTWLIKPPRTISTTTSTTTSSDVISSSDSRREKRKKKKKQRKLNDAATGTGTAADGDKINNNSSELEDEDAADDDEEL